MAAGDRSDDGGDALPAFPAIDAHEDLLAWSRAYAGHVVRTTDLGVDLERVEWRVSTRAKRRAAGVEWPRVPDAAVGEPLDWTTVAAGDDGGPPTCTVALTWAAYEEFAREEWTATLRHELVHVEQYQRFGTTDHGDRFRERAAALDAPVRCRRFAPPAYRLRCRDCGEEVGVRYRSSTVVEEPGRYRSRCCGAALAVEEGPAAD